MYGQREILFDIHSLSTILLFLTRKTIIIVLSPISTSKPMYQSLTLPSTKKDFQLLAANTFTVRDMSEEPFLQPTNKCEYSWKGILVPFQKNLSITSYWTECLTIQHGHRPWHSNMIISWHYGSLARSLCKLMIIQRVYSLLHHAGYKGCATETSNTSSQICQHMSSGDLEKLIKLGQPN